MSGYLIGAIPTLLGVIVGAFLSRSRSDWRFTKAALRASRVQIADATPPTTAELNAGWVAP